MINKISLKTTLNYMLNSNNSILKILPKKKIEMIDIECHQQSYTAEKQNIFIKTLESFNI